MSRSDDPAFRQSNGYVGFCPDCQKRSYVSRKAARQAARNARKGHMQAYECPVSDGQWWHHGHMPGVVRRGELDKDTWREGKR